MASLLPCTWILLFIIKNNYVYENYIIIKVLNLREKSFSRK